MFTKMLIANRGEIACRVIKTARRMGIQTVAVFSDADAKARHVRVADEAVHIGPSAARESYLVIEKIIAAAKATGAQAIHPGYGFLSENEDFCHACDEAGIVFIGPPVNAIRAMGSKSEAKKLMGEAGVPLTPGYHGDNQDPEYLHGQADAIGYPVLIKAAAGGGGKGMRLVERSTDFPEALISCKREALSSFGDEHVLIEKYITQPRHIEIQVFADQHGQYAYLFERDCSVQRRHQKVLEEAPAPGMTPERRAAMGNAAVEAAKAVGYVGAGTVEFIANQDGTFYFMEMNTRLQVEHPVTEMITGLDLVEWQLKVAAGQPLPLTQEQLQINGHAMEARIYAEDPSKGFLPSTGRLLHLTNPAAGLGAVENVRVDTGVEEGDEISPFYDPMIAKLIVWGEDREAARLKMIRALAEYHVVGVANNVSFLTRLCECDSFAKAHLDTGLIERERAFLLPAQTHSPFEVVALAAAWKLQDEAKQQRALQLKSQDPTNPWAITDGWKMNLPAQRLMKFRQGDLEQVLILSYLRTGYEMELDGHKALVKINSGASGELDTNLELSIDDKLVKGKVVVQAGPGHQETRLHVFVEGKNHSILWIDPLHFTAGDHDHAGDVLAPMPGKVIALLAAEGQRLEKGKPLLVLEAMKMEHTLHAPATGVLKAYRFAVGDQVKEGDELVEFEVES